MKKTLTVLVLTGLMLTGCGGKQSATQPTATPTAVAAVAETVTVPDVMGLTLDKATDQLEDLGFEVKAVDTAKGKSIIIKKNWQVTSQDGAAGAQVAKRSAVHLGVTNLDDKAAAEKAAADKAAADKVAAEAAAAAKASVAKAAADQAAAQQMAAQKAAEAAAQQAAQQAAVKPAPVVQAPAEVYYANCTAAKAAGAAPVYAGTPGYGTHLDRDRDGIGCDK
ncbi:excalibur calcium-binding domain-containing protein [Arthrobacter sp. 754]|uniref:excalibur calcium-binding domain-containing protein n=1 Tax=Arthrobacter sp. 754 TaxID=3156315 RepID=UPI003391FE45